MGEGNRNALVAATPKYESYEEEVDVETEEEYEETVEREMIKDVVQEVTVAQVKALYPYTGQGITMKKGEVSGYDIYIKDVGKGKTIADSIKKCSLR